MRRGAGIASMRPMRTLTRHSSVALGALLLGAASWSAPAPAAELVVTIAELDAALDTLDDGAGSDGTGRAALEALVVRRIADELADADVELEAGALVHDERIVNREFRDGCTETLIRSLDARVRLTRDTRLALELDSLDAPIRISLDVAAELSASGRARQRLGVRLGDCRRLATDNFDVTASGPFRIRLDVELELAPSFAPPATLRFEPRVRVTGDLVASDVDVDVDDSLLSGLIENLLTDLIEDAFSPERVAGELAALRADVAGALDAELDGGAVEIALPVPDDERTRRLYALFGPERPLELTLAHLDDRRVEFLAAIVLGDADALEALVGDAASCEALGLLRASLPRAPAYTLAGGACEVAAFPGDRGPLPTDGSGVTGPATLYADAGCTRAFEFSPTSMPEYCLATLDPLRLGTPAHDETDLDRWTLWPGTALDALALPATGTAQPYTVRTRYRSVETDGGTCELEMRVHVPVPDVSVPDVSDPDGTGADALARRPVLAFHGGSWSGRTTGALGIEAMARHFVDAGFTVFQPFYRLLGDDEAVPACRNAAFDDVVADAHAALDWTAANAARYGAAGRPIVFGQSAGGQLAANLAVERADEIERAVLFYAPTDFGDFAARIRSGAYDYPAGLNILERVFDEPAADVAPDDPLLLRHSLPARIAADPGSVPPMFLLHGEMDELLPFRQSVRACNALAGDPEGGPAPLGPELVELRRTLACDARTSELHLIAEGEHALDACLGAGLCLSGSPESAALVADSIRRMLAWAGEPRPVPAAPASDAAPAGTAPSDGAAAPPADGALGVVPDGGAAVATTGGGAGGGALAWAGTLLLLGASIARRATRRLGRAHAVPTLQFRTPRSIERIGR